MRPERPKDSPKEIQKLAEKSVRSAPTVNFSRVISVTAPTFEEEDIQSIEAEERRHSQLVASSNRYYRLALLMEQMGANNDYFRHQLQVTDPTQRAFDNIKFFVSGLGSGRLTIGLYNAIVAPFKKELEKNTYYQDLELELALETADPDIPYSVIIGESLRVEEENLGLLRIYLEEKRAERRKEKKENKLRRQSKPKPVTPEEDPLVLAAEEITIQPEDHQQIIPPQPLILPEWQLSYTTNRFSDLPQYLVPLQPEGRSGLIEQYRRIMLKEGVAVPVKPASIIEAIRFHLEKTHLQRAMSLRNKYWNPDWSKIKRGDARIFCKIDENQHSCIFFAGHRKDIYTDME